MGFGPGRLSFQSDLLLLPEPRTRIGDCRRSWHVFIRQSTIKQRRDLCSANFFRTILYDLSNVSDLSIFLSAEEAAALPVSAASGKRAARRYLHFCEHDFVSDNMEHTYVRGVRQAVRRRRISGPAFHSVLSRDADLFSAAHVLPG